MRPPIHYQAQAAIIESGRVLDVDMATYTLTVTTQFTKKPQSGVSFATPYQHFVNGEGIYFMPEVGSLCWVCFPSDSQRPFVLAWASAQVEEDFRARKKELNPGDIYLGTRDENFVVLRRGGVLEMGATPLCQRLFLPIENTIRDFCENYALHTLGGDLEWSIGRTEDTQDGHRPAQLTLRAREYADDAQPLAELTIGSHGEGSPTILSLLIRDSGQEGAARRIELTFDKDGSTRWHFEKDCTWTVGGATRLTSKGAVHLKGEDTVKLESTKTMTLESRSGMMLKSADQMSLAAPLVDVQQRMAVGGGAAPVLLGNAYFLQWLATHTHVAQGPTSPTSPPVPPLVSSLATAKALTSS